jgi:hypothetical protein
MGEKGPAGPVLDQTRSAYNGLFSTSGFKKKRGKSEFKVIEQKVTR